MAYHTAVIDGLDIMLRLYDHGELDEIEGGSREDKSILGANEQT